MNEAGAFNGKIFLIGKQKIAYKGKPFKIITNFSKCGLKSMAGQL
jgi:hypothetical protein